MDWDLLRNVCDRTEVFGADVGGQYYARTKTASDRPTRLGVLRGTDFGAAERSLRLVIEIE